MVIYNMVFYVRNKKIGSNYLCENTPYYLKHVLTDKHITIENKEGSDLLRKDFIRLTNDVEVGHTSHHRKKVCTGYGIFDHCYRIKVSNPSQNDYDYITKTQLVVSISILIILKMQLVGICKLFPKIYVQP
jgi:hypothetical protein